MSSPITDKHQPLSPAAFNLIRYEDPRWAEPVETCEGRGVHSVRGRPSPSRHYGYEPWFHYLGLPTLR